MCILFGYFKKYVNEFEIKQLPPIREARKSSTRIRLEVFK